MKPIEAADVAAMMAYAERVVIVPGYGLAVAQAQHKIWELAQRLMDRGVKVKFAIHPVAGPHARAHERAAGRGRRALRPDRRHGRHQPGIPHTDVSLVIGANDVVNPVAKTDPGSPIYGMPILNVVDSKNTIVIKRGKGTGFAGIENAVLRRQHAHAVRRRRRDGQRAGQRTEGARRRALRLAGIDRARRSDLCGAGNSARARSGVDDEQNDICRCHFHRRRVCHERACLGRHPISRPNRDRIEHVHAERADHRYQDPPARQWLQNEGTTNSFVICSFDAPPGAYFINSTEFSQAFLFYCPWMASRVTSPVRGQFDSRFRG